MTAWKIFWTVTVVYWCKTLEKLLYLLANVLCLSEGPRKHSVSDYNPYDCGTTWTYGILLAIPGFLQIMCFKGTHKKKSLLFPCISYIFFPFIQFKSHCQTPGKKQFQSHLLPKNNWRSQKKKKKGSSLSCRADHIVLTHSCAASQGWALTGITHHVLGSTSGSGNPFIQWQWVLQLNYALWE